ncbi:MAG: type VI secretion system baseplate subunit TssF [Deltaproteobacteria bacterium]|nr:type VI secretion system baseplate subunit TssF [Deltaproteobacteria bacterium]
MFSKFYQGELAFLRAMGQAYAAANPTTAGLLSERGSDPDVERLLEGFAFLAARVRERIEDGVPEIAHDLTEILLPHYLRPVPACTVIEFLPIPGALRARVKLPRETEMASVPVQGTKCLFRTSADMDLLPVTVLDAQLDQAIGANPVLRLQLQVAAPSLPAVLQPEGIRFFVHGELPLASTLLLWLGRHLRGLTVKGLGTGGRTLALDPASVRPCGFDPELPLLPWPRLAPSGYRCLQEFFTLPQKFLFFEVRNLQAALPAAEERFELAFQFERPPELPARLGKENFRPNCVPAVNLFRTSADPVAVEVLAEEHLLRATELPPGHMEVYAVESVVGIPEVGSRYAYEPFSRFGHASGKGDARYYRLRRAISPVDHGLDTWISTMRPLDAGAAPGPETLSIEATCTNRSLPAELRIGDVSQPTPSSPTLARFRNLLPVTPPVRPPLGSELHWRLLAHLAASRASLGDVQVLRSLLDLYNLQGTSDERTGRGNRLRVEGIEAAAESASRRVVGGAPVRGSRLLLTLDEAHFAGLGDAWIFASALDQLLGSQVGLNAFTELSVLLTPSRREYAFAPRSGGRALV